MRAKITKSLVDSLTAGDIVTDTELNGFRIRCGTHGKIYSVQKRVGSKVLTRTIGRHGIYTPDAARREAQQILLQLSQGEDPLATQRKEALLNNLTFGTLVDLYEAKLKNPNTLNDVKKRVRVKLASWLKLPANDITRAMVLTKFRALSKIGPTQAGLIMRYVRAIYNNGIAEYRDDRTDESVITQNPVKVLTEKRELKVPRRRDSFLKPHELKKWYEAWLVSRREFPTACDYLMTTLLLGCRRTESAKLQWRHIDLQHRSIVFRDTKNKTDHFLPVGNYLCRLLADRKPSSATPDDYVFPADSKAGYITEPRPAIDRIAEESGQRIIMGDLRRTFATYADGLDFSPYTIKRLMNHLTNAGQDVTQGYIGLDLERYRKRMQELEDNILKLAGAFDTPVIHLPEYISANK